MQRLRKPTATLGLFAFGGLASGLITISLFVLLPTHSLEVAGAVFATAIVTSLALAQHLKWISVSYSLVRCILASLLLSAAGPLVVWTMQLTQILFETSCNSLLTHASCERWQNTELVSVVALAIPIEIVSIFLLSLALRAVTKKWVGKEFLWLLVITVAAIWVSLVLTFLLSDAGASIRLRGEDWTFFAMLATLGQATAAVACGRWIVAAAVSPGDVMC